MRASGKLMVLPAAVVVAAAIVLVGGTSARGAREQAAVLRIATSMPNDPSGALVGFLFGLPNRLEGDRPHSAILKTYASGRRGVCRLLADTFHRTARDLGFTETIHALMHVDNVSAERSGRHAGRVFRRYALMGRHLA